MKKTKQGIIIKIEDKRNKIFKENRIGKFSITRELLETMNDKTLKAYQKFFIPVKIDHNFWSSSRPVYEVIAFSKGFKSISPNMVYDYV